MKKQFPSTAVIALEANPRVYNHFKTVVSAAGVDYQNVAVTATPGLMDLFIPEVIAGNKMPEIGRMGSLREVGLRDSKTVKVEVRGEQLDTLLKEHSFDAACLWIDVEGVLDQVLEGAVDTLKKTKILYTEVEISPVWKGQVLAQGNLDKLAELGYHLVARDCQKWFQYNALFLHESVTNDPVLNQLIVNYCKLSLKTFDS